MTLKLTRGPTSFVAEGVDTTDPVFNTQNPRLIQEHAWNFIYKQ